MACIGCNAQMKVLINKMNGEVDTYPFNESTKITFNDGNLLFSSIIATQQYSPRDIKKMTFGALVSSILLDPSSAIIEIGNMVTLSATISPSNAVNKEVIWSSSNEDIAMVSSKGVVFGMAEGEVSITAESTDGSGIKASCNIKVIPVKVQSITLNYEVYSLGKGESVVLEATVLPENAGNKDVEWMSSNEDVVLVSKNGRVVCIDDGEATVTATAKDGSGVSASCVFNCLNGITTITINDDDLMIYDANGMILTEKKEGLNIIKHGKKDANKVLLR